MSRERTARSDSGASAGGGAAPASSALLDHLAEVLVAAALAATALLYSSRLSDNFLAKGGIVLILGPAAFGVWAWARLRSGQIQLVRSGLYLPFGAVIAAQTVSLALAQNQGRALEVTSQSAAHFLLFFTALHLYRDVCRWQRLMGLVLGLGLCISAIGLLHSAGLQVLELPAGYQRTPISTLGNTNFVAHYLDLVIPLAAAVALICRGSGWRPAALAVLSVTALHLVLTESRGGWLSTAIGAGAVLAVCAPRRRWGSRLILALVVLALLSPVAGFVLEAIHLGDGQTLYDRATQVAEQTVTRTRTAFEAADFSRAMRFLIWQDTAQLISDNPWVGVGPGSFGLHLVAHRSTVGHRAWSELMGRRANVAYHAHNEYLEAWAESGILGMVSLIWLMAAATWTTWRQALWVRQTVKVGGSGKTECSAQTADAGAPGFTGAALHRHRLGLALGCAGAVTAAAVHAVFSFNLQDPVSGTHLWVLVGLAGGAVACMGRSSDAPVRVFRTRWRIAGAVPVGAVALVGAYLGVCIIVGDAYYFTGLEHLSHGHPNRALLAFRQAAEWRGRDFRHHHTLGKTALEVGRLDEAEAALRRSLDLHPYSPQALRLLGRTMMGQREPAQAVDAFRRAVRVEPLKADNYTLLAGGLAAAGDHAGAVRARQQALAFRPEDARLMMSLAIAYRDAGQLAEAATVLERAHSLSPRDGVIIGNQGAIQLSLGELIRAEELLRIALQLDPDNQTSWRANLAQALMLQGRHAEALIEARRAAIAAPQDPALQKLVERLTELVGGDTDG